MIGIIFDMICDVLDKRLTETKSNDFKYTITEKEIPQEISDELEKLRQDNSQLVDKIVEISEENYKLVEENKMLHNIVNKLY